jgi:hypothetical protein
MNTVTSADSTRIALERIGTGAPVILIGGAYNDRSTMAALAAVIQDSGGQASVFGHASGPVPTCTSAWSG